MKDQPQICCFYLPASGSRLGLVTGGMVYDLTASEHPELSSLSALLRASTSRPLHALIKEADPDTLPTYHYEMLDRAPSPRAPHLLPPVDRQEIWAAGVTYAWSRAAREREAINKDIYVRVYGAERPELFFKSLPEKAVGPNDWLGLRADSRWNVPEPELTLVLNPDLAIIGYTIGNDMSSRDIEGENPLYLPQAKIFRHGCGLGPVITLLDGGLDGRGLAIRLTIKRGGTLIFQGETSTDRMHRRPSELAAYLGRDNDFPNGALLLTGTGIVPDDDFTLQDGDEVAIEMDSVGVLRNVIRQM